MRLAKQHLDIGVFTNNVEPMLKFWQEEAGLPFEELLVISRGSVQHRHNLNGSVFKLNHLSDPLPASGPSGYRRLYIARDVSQPCELRDPEGNPVSLVPRGWHGIEGLGVDVTVRSLEASRRYYREALRLEELDPGTFRCGDTLLFLREEPGQPETGEMRGPGYRYLTAQVWSADEEFAKVVESGGREGSPPTTLGSVARIAFVRDPDGNWLEISQRASLTGPLPPG
jgi:catechol 2,3-dioxygenase-like lactoylglutathione lyase family enzyme